MLTPDRKVTLCRSLNVTMGDSRKVAYLFWPDLAMPTTGSPEAVIPDF